MSKVMQIHLTNEMNAFRTMKHELLLKTLEGFHVILKGLLSDVCVSIIKASGSDT